MSNESGVDTGRREHPSVSIRWNVAIPMRDGTELRGVLYQSRAHESPTPVIFVLTPYIASRWHEQGIYFASRGLPFLSVDVRGRGDSGGEFRPLIQEARDGHDVVEWIASQPFCNGKVAMWGGSYSGYAQWATASQGPPHLATIVPTAPAFVSVDFPIRKNMPRPYLAQWLTFVGGKAAHDRVFEDVKFLRDQFLQFARSGAPFKELGQFVGLPRGTFEEWIAHPQQDEYWDRFNPTPQQYSQMSLPILTITGIYDADQAGALMHYKQHLSNAPAAARSNHHLVIGPWDHAGTRAPKERFFGIKVGPASLIDMGQLHLDWYRWTMQSGPKPEFLSKNVRYYVMGAEKWRSADSLEDITAREVPLYLQSTSNPTDVFCPGSLSASLAGSESANHYEYDPLDLSLAELESSIDPDDRTDQRMVLAAKGKHLVYQSAPFSEDTEISGFFKLSVWLSIDRPDTDFRATLFEIGSDGQTLHLTMDSVQARYRESLREPVLIRTTEPLRYNFMSFAFISRRFTKGSRIRLVIGPINSIHAQRNYNSGGNVAAETRADARTVHVELFHGGQYPSALTVPFGHPDTDERN